MPASDLSDRALVAVRRTWPRFDPNVDLLAEERTEGGTLINVYLGADRDLGGRIYLDYETGTIYNVPTWVSRAALMRGAVADPAQRANLVVI